MAKILKATPTNWYYCIEADEAILPSQVPSKLACNWLSYTRSPEQDKNRLKNAHEDRGAIETTVGKWLIFASSIDELWPILLQATAEGRLGIGVKAATPYMGGNLICVYTADYQDKEDTDRVYDALRELGIGGRLNYKPDFMTYEGKSGSIWTAGPGERPHRPKNYKGDTPTTSITPTRATRKTPKHETTVYDSERTEEWLQENDFYESSYFQDIMSRDD